MFTWQFQNPLHFIYNVTIPEAITFQMEDDGGIIMPENIETLKSVSNTMDAVVIGPGLSAKPQISRWVGDFIADCRKPVVIDADALNVIAEQPDVFLERKAPQLLLLIRVSSRV